MKERLGPVHEEELDLVSCLFRRLYFLFVVKRADGALGMSCCLCGPPRHTLQFTWPHRRESPQQHQNQVRAAPCVAVPPPVRPSSGLSLGCPKDPQL